MADQQLRFAITASDAASGTLARVGGALRDINGAAAGVVGVFRSFGGALGSAAIVGGLTAFVRSTAAGLDALNDLKDATGASIENISALEDVAARTGTSFDTVGASLVRFNQALAGAKPGSEVAEAFDRLGLSVAELKALDPAEALRRAAVALAGFADDGTRARYVQELFGRSVREVAPFLNDLAAKGELVAKVTTEQAQAAERFNQQLDALGKNAKDAGRALAGNLLPAINAVLERVAKSDLLAGNLKGVLGTDELGNLQSLAQAQSNAMTLVGQQLERFDRLAANGVAGAAERAADLRGQLTSLQTRALETTAKIKALTDTLAPNLGDRAREDRGFTPPLPKLPDLVGDTKKLREAKVSFEDYAASITQGIARLAEDTQTVKLANLNAQLAELDRLAAAGLDPQIVREVRTALEGFATVEIPPETVERMRQVGDILAQTPSGMLDELVNLESALVEANLPAEQLAEALAVLDKRFEALIEPIDETTEEISRFADQAARNIQDALGDTLVNVLEGNFKSIGKLWENLITRMVAQALAANLNEALFGKSFSGGLFGAAIQGIFGGVGGGGAAGAANGQWDILPPASAPAGVGGNTVVYNVAAGVSRNELLTALQMAQASNRADTQQTLRRAGVT